MSHISAKKQPTGYHAFQRPFTRNVSKKKNNKTGLYQLLSAGSNDYLFVTVEDRSGTDERVIFHQVPWRRLLIFSPQHMSDVGHQSPSPNSLPVPLHRPPPRDNGANKESMTWTSAINWPLTLPFQFRFCYFFPCGEVMNCEMLSCYNASAERGFRRIGASSVLWQ